MVCLTLRCTLGLPVISPTAMFKALAVCLLNVSEGRNAAIIEKIAQAACISSTRTRDRASPTTPKSNTVYNGNQEVFKCLSAVLNIFSDYDYNRSVLTIAAPIEWLLESVTNSCKVAYKEIDLREHYGHHPRLGAIDLIPVYPISPVVSLEQCRKVAEDIGRQIIKETPGTSVFFYGTGDRPEERSLVKRRKEVGWYKGKHGMSYCDIPFDIGVAPTPWYGLTGVGASWYVMNVNVTIETSDMTTGRKIAGMIRGSSDGGLPGVQAMAFEHEKNIEIACNVESYIEENKTKSSKLQYTSPIQIQERIKTLASQYDINVCDTTIVGFTPDEVYTMAMKALTEGNAMAWKTTQLHRM